MSLGFVHAKKTLTVYSPVAGVRPGIQLQSSLTVFRMAISQMTKQQSSDPWFWQLKLESSPNGRSLKMGPNVSGQGIHSSINQSLHLLCKPTFGGLQILGIWVRDMRSRTAEECEIPNSGTVSSHKGEIKNPNLRQPQTLHLFPKFPFRRVCN